MELKGDYLGMALSVDDLDIENLEYFKHCAAHDFHLQQCDDCKKLRRMTIADPVSGLAQPRLAVTSTFFTARQPPSR